MAYNANIPQPTDAISDSQNDILDNFQSINTWVQVNHTGFDSPPNTGKHTVVELPQQAMATVTPVGEVAIECLSSAYNANGPELIYLPENAGARVEMTASLKATNGWTFLPSGLLIKWGRFLVAAAGTAVVPFPAGAGIPAYGMTVYNITFQVSNGAATDPNWAITLNTATTTLANIGYNAVARDSAVATIPTFIYYYAIGI
jgi:hypothetical protein